MGTRRGGLAGEVSPAALGALGACWLLTNEHFASARVRRNGDSPEGPRTSSTRPRAAARLGLSPAAERSPQRPIPTPDCPRCARPSG